MLYFIYSNGELIGFRYGSNSESFYYHNTYYYIKNLQGDIIGIKDNNLNTIVTYEYDSWGKIISIKDDLGNEITNINHIAMINPFRYRSYYYDDETKLYYLNSRYYNPTWGRFINADGIIGANYDVINYNLYVYCSNNFIVLQDSNGNWSFAKFITKVAKQIVKAVKKIINTAQKKEPEPLPDYTEELNKVLISNAGMMYQVNNNFNGAESTKYFYDKVKAGGQWDYKLEDNWEKDINVPYLGVHGLFIYNGVITTAEDFGNIHYGFVGTAAGYTPIVLYMGGGYAKCKISFDVLKPPYYCDDENDHYAIERGINMFYSHLK